MTEEPPYATYLEALLVGDRETCHRIFQAWLARDANLRALYEDLVQRSLYEVGELWERGRVSVATEHLATAISEGLLHLVYPRLFARPRCGKVALVACVGHEIHQVGARMVADFFELHGWRGYFLGAETPVADVIAFLREKRPDVLALSFTVAFNLASLVEAARTIREAFPTLPILVGGQALRWGGQERGDKASRVRERSEWERAPRAIHGTTEGSRRSPLSWKEPLEQIPGVRCLGGLADLEAWITGGAP